MDNSGVDDVSGLQSSNFPSSLDFTQPTGFAGNGGDGDGAANDPLDFMKPSASGAGPDVPVDDANAEPPGLWTVKAHEMSLLPGVPLLESNPTAQPFSNDAKAYVAKQTAQLKNGNSDTGISTMSANAAPAASATPGGAGDSGDGGMIPLLTDPVSVPANGGGADAGGSQAVAQPDGKPTLEEAEPDFSRRPYDALVDAEKKGIFPPGQMDGVKNIAWTVQQRNIAAEGMTKPYFFTGDGKFFPNGNDPIGSVDAAMADGVLDPATGMQMRGSLARGEPVDFNAYNSHFSNAEIHGNDFRLTNHEAASPAKPDAGMGAITLPGQAPKEQMIQLPDGTPARFYYTESDGRYFPVIEPVQPPAQQKPAVTTPPDDNNALQPVANRLPDNAQPQPGMETGNGGPVQSAPESPQPAMDAGGTSQGAPERAPAATEAEYIRQKYQAGEIGKETALRLLQTVGRRGKQNFLDDAGTVAYEAAKETAALGVANAAAAGGTALGLLTGPAAPVAAPVLGAAGFALGDKFAHIGIDKLEDYLAGKSDGFAQMLREHDESPVLQEVGRTIPQVVMAGRSERGYQQLAKKGWRPVAGRAAASAAGMAGTNALMTGLTERRMPTGKETLQAAQTGVLYGGAIGKEKDRLDFMKHRAKARTPEELDFTKPRLSLSVKKTDANLVDIARETDKQNAKEQEKDIDSFERRQNERNEKPIVNWKSVKQFGHTFKEHGQRTLKNQINNAKSRSREEGVWLNNEKAADFLNGLNLSEKEVVYAEIPDGIGVFITKEGMVKPAKFATIVPSKTGIRTAYPISKEKYEEFTKH